MFGIDKQSASVIMLLASEELGSGEDRPNGPKPPGSRRLFSGPPADPRTAGGNPSSPPPEGRHGRPRSSMDRPTGHRRRHSPDRKATARMIKPLANQPATPAYFRLTGAGCRLGSWYLISDGSQVTRTQLMVDHCWTSHTLNVVEAQVMMVEPQPPLTRSSADREALARRKSRG